MESRTARCSNTESMNTHARESSEGLTSKHDRVSPVDLVIIHIDGSCLSCEGLNVSNRVAYSFDLSFAQKSNPGQKSSAAEQEHCMHRLASIVW